MVYMRMVVVYNLELKLDLSPFGSLYYEQTDCFVMHVLDGHREQ